MPMEIQRSLRRKHKVATDGRVLCRAFVMAGGAFARDASSASTRLTAKRGSSS